VILPGLVASASAQALPSAPISFSNGRVVLGGEASIAAAPRRDGGFFNYADYRQNVLRLVQLGGSFSVRAADRIWLLGDLRTENAETFRAHGLYVRLRPWNAHAVDLQIGRIPPVFGVFARRSYAGDNPLVGHPLAYQYLTAIRSDAVPATTHDLLAMRGGGWLVRYPIGSSSPDRGLPLISAARWDTGAQIRAAWRLLEVSAAVTRGTLSNPRITDDNDGRQISTRIALRPSTGLIVGVSAAQGPYLADRVQATAGPAASRFRQRALGIDLEYSRDYWLLRSEAVWNRWELPFGDQDRIRQPLDAAAVFVEGRYRLAPAIYVAARIDHLGFSRIVSPYGGMETWDAPVTRVEIGGGYYVRRNVMAKAVYQQNWRDGGRRVRHGSPAVQLLYWF
jgi:hypothetical protein